jgi:hypothetical protein
VSRRKRNGKKLKGLLKGGGISKRIFPVVKTLSAPIAFLEQITAKDRQDLGQSFTTAGYSTQLKIMSNIVLGRLAGITPFHKLSDGTMLPTAPQTINPAGVMNKWTNAGLIGLGYQIIGKNINKAVGTPIIPETAKIGSISKSVFIGGALGGFFDDSPTKQTQTFARQSFPTTNRALVNTTYNSGSDSTGSSF